MVRGKARYLGVFNDEIMAALAAALGRKVFHPYSQEATMTQDEIFQAILRPNDKAARDAGHLIEPCPDCGDAKKVDISEHPWRVPCPTCQKGEENE